MKKGHPAIRRIHEELSQLSKEILDLKEAYLRGEVDFEEYREKRTELEIEYERLAEERLRKYTKSKK